MLTPAQKREVVKKARQKLKNNEALVFSNFKGLTVDQQRELKNQFKEIGGESFVIKRRLFNLSLEKEGIDFSEITGSLMIGAGGDEVAVSKVFKDFFEKELESNREKLSFVGGVVNNSPGNNPQYEVLSKEEVQELAQLGSKEEVLGKLVGVLSSPLRNLNSTLQGNLQKLVYVISTQS